MSMNVDLDKLEAAAKEAQERFPERWEHVVDDDGYHPSVILALIVELREARQTEEAIRRSERERCREAVDSEFGLYPPSGTEEHKAFIIAIRPTVMATNAQVMRAFDALPIMPEAPSDRP